MGTGSFSFAKGVSKFVVLSVTDIGGNSDNPPVESSVGDGEVLFPDAITFSVCLGLNVRDRCLKPITIKIKLGNAHIIVKTVAAVSWSMPFIAIIRTNVITASANPIAPIETSLVPA